MLENNKDNRSTSYSFVYRRLAKEPDSDCRERYAKQRRSNTESLESEPENSLSARQEIFREGNLIFPRDKDTLFSFLDFINTEYLLNVRS